MNHCGACATDGESGLSFSYHKTESGGEANLYFHLLHTRRWVTPCLHSLEVWEPLVSDHPASRFLFNGPQSSLGHL